MHALPGSRTRIGFLEFQSTIRTREQQFTIFTIFSINIQLLEGCSCNVVEAELGTKEWSEWSRSFSGKEANHPNVNCPSPFGFSSWCLPTSTDKGIPFRYNCWGLLSGSDRLTHPISLSTVPLLLMQHWGTETRCAEHSWRPKRQERRNHAKSKSFQKQRLISLRVGAPEIHLSHAAWHLEWMYGAPLTVPRHCTHSGYGFILPNPPLKTSKVGRNPDHLSRLKLPSSACLAMATTFMTFHFGISGWYHISWTFQILPNPFSWVFADLWRTINLDPDVKNWHVHFPLYVRRSLNELPWVFVGAVVLNQKVQKSYSRFVPLHVRIPSLDSCQSSRHVPPVQLAKCLGHSWMPATINGVVKWSLDIDEKDKWKFRLVARAYTSKENMFSPATEYVPPLQEPTTISLDQNDQFDWSSAFL